MSDESDHRQIQLLIETINNAWIERREHELSGCFDPDIVIRGVPGFQTMGAGRETCINSYREFNRRATVKEFKSSEPAIDVFAGTGIAGFDWEIRYELGGKEYHETGYDVFVLRRGDGEWRAVWRGVSVPKQS